MSPPKLGIALLHFILPFFFVIQIAVSATQEGYIPRCYYPDGTLAANDYACRLNTTESFCCTTGVKCLDNKICDVVNPTQYRYNRGTCTDKTWTSDECPKFCQAQNPTYGSGVIRCPNANGKVCCDNGNKDSTSTCCQDESNFFDLEGDWDVFRTIDKSAASSTRSAASSSAATGTTTKASATATTASEVNGGGEGRGLQTGVIVGIAIGGFAGAAALGALAFWMVKKNRRRKDPPVAAELEGYEMRHEMKAEDTTHELDVGEPPQELSSGDERHEMEGSSPLDQKLMKGKDDQGTR